MTQEICEVTFRVKVLTNLNQHVRITGSFPELGIWDPYKALQLTTSIEEYPFWSNTAPLLLPKRTKFEFKIIVFEYDYLQRWEYIQGHDNRKYKIRYHKSQILCAEGDPITRENVLEKIEESFSSLEITKVIRRRPKDNSDFNPFRIAASDDDSDPSVVEMRSSSFNSGSDDELTKPFPIKTSFYHAPAFADDFMFLPTPKIEDSQKIKELYAQMRSQSNNRLWHTSSRYTFHDAFYDVNEEDLTFFEEKDMVYIATFHLPVKINFDSEGNYEIVPNYAHELLSLYEFCKQNQRSRFIWIGLHPHIPSKYREEIEDVLSAEHGCQPVYLTSEMYNTFRHKCKNYLWCHLQKIDIANKFERSDDFWNIYELVSYKVAEKILSLQDRGYVLINDYRFMLIPGICTKQRPSMKFHYILNFSFPSSHSFASVPYYLQMISSMLCSSVLSFESHDDMNNFVDTVQEIFGGRLMSQAGYLTLQFFGRFIILNTNAHLKRAYLTREKEKVYLNISRQKSANVEFEFKEVVFLSVDSVSVRSGIDQKFRAFEQLFNENDEMVGKVKLIQIFKIVSDLNDEEQRQTLRQIESQAAIINEKYSSKDYTPIQIIADSSESSEWIQEYYSKAHIFIDTNIEKYENSYLNSCMKYTQDKTLIIVQEQLYERYSDFVFTFTVNPFSIHDIASQMRNCFDIVVNLNDNVVSNVYNGKLPLNYIEEWLGKSNLAILKTNLLMRNAKLFNTHTFSQINTYEHILAACSWNFKKPIFNDVPIKYFTATNKVFIFPIEIFFKNETLEMLKLGRSVDSVLPPRSTRMETLEPIQRLASNESNVIIVLTGKSHELVDGVFTDIKNLHLLAENGCFYKNSNQNRWVNISGEELTFKQTVLPIMKKYQRRLENCFVVEKDSTLKFKIKGGGHSNMTQLMISTLYKEIVQALGENDKVEVFCTDRSITVRPFGINKGTVIQILLQKTFQEKGKIGFLFCLGKSQGDEEIFAGIYRSLKMSQEIFPEVKHIFTCAVGHRPSHANYFVNTREEVRRLLNSF